LQSIVSYITLAAPQNASMRSAGFEVAFGE